MNNNEMDMLMKKLVRVLKLKLFFSSFESVPNHLKMF